MDNEVRLLKTAVLICFVVVVTSCTSVRYIEEEKRAFPIRPEFWLKDQQTLHHKATPMETNAIFVMQSGSSPRFHFYRFWSDGHVCHRSLALEKSPTTEDANSFYGCDMGYYTYDGTNVLIELFMPDGFYFMATAISSGGSIQTQQEGVRHQWRWSSEPASFRRRDYVYRRLAVGELKSTPDW